MYQIYCDNVLIGDSRIEELCVINPIVRLEVNSAGWFTFTFPATHPHINSINPLTSVIKVLRDNELVFQGFATNPVTDIFGNKGITCEGELSYLNDSILRQAKYSGISVRDLLYDYIAKHNAQVEARKQFTLGRVTVTDPNNSVYCFTNMQSTLQEIKEDLIEDYGGYISVRYADGVKYIDYLSEADMVEAQQTIELGKNLISYSSNIDDTVITTRVIPLGEQLDTEVVEGLPARLDIKSVNSGLDYLDNANGIANFGTITKVVTWDDVTVPANLKAKGLQWLADNQFENVVIDVTAIDLSMVDSHFEPFKLFDKVHVVSTYHGMDRWFMLSKITFDLANPERDTYTLGKTIHPSLTVKANNVSAGISKVVEETTGMENNWLKKAKQQASDLISGVDGGYVVLNVDQNGKPFELLVMDTDKKETAHKVWRWNQNGFGYSSNGYNGTYGTAITMNGEIVADYITAGTIRGITITGNTINGNTINGGTINGTEFNASGSIRRYRSDYSQSDVDRINGIQLGTITPTMDDYEKYDLNGNGVIDVRDKVIIRQLIQGTYGDYYELQCPVKLNGSNKLGTVKTENTMLTNNGVLSGNLNINNGLFVTSDSGTPNRVKISVRDNDGSEEIATTGEYRGIDGIKVVKGLVTAVYLGNNS